MNSKKLFQVSKLSLKFIETVLIVVIVILINQHKCLLIY